MPSPGQKQLFTTHQVFGEALLLLLLLLLFIIIIFSQVFPGTFPLGPVVNPKTQASSF
jgi:hypothetical protein